MGKAKCKSFDFLSKNKYYNNLSLEKSKEAFLYTFPRSLAFERITIVVPCSDKTMQQ